MGFHILLWLWIINLHLLKVYLANLVSLRMSNEVTLRKPIEELSWCVYNMLKSSTHFSSFLTMVPMTRIIVKSRIRPFQPRGSQENMIKSQCKIGPYPWYQLCTEYFNRSVQYKILQAFFWVDNPF